MRILCGVRQLCKSGLTVHPLSPCPGSVRPSDGATRCGRDVNPNPFQGGGFSSPRVTSWAGLWRHRVGECYRSRDICISLVLTVKPFALNRGDERAYFGFCKCMSVYTVRTFSVMFWYDSIRIVKTDMHICARKWFFADIKL